MPRLRDVDEDSSDDSSTSASEDVNDEPSLIYYPAYCHKVSPTWFTWVKVTAYNIHHDLHEQPRKPGANNARDEIIILPRVYHTQPQTRLLYCLNHPIQFVQIVGVVVSIEEFLDWFWVFTVDDSSGVTIDVHCKKPPREEKKVNTGIESAVAAVAANETSVKATLEDIEERKAQELRTGFVSRLDIGNVVQVKGTIGAFRGTRKIQLERIVLVPDTMAEMRLIAARTKTLKEVLSRPWIVTPSEQEKLLKEARGELDEENARLKRRLKRQALNEERERRHARQILKEYEADEIKRKQMADEAQEAGRRLKRKSSTRSL